jgi:hypothetical protein
LRAERANETAYLGTKPTRRRFQAAANFGKRFARLMAALLSDERVENVLPHLAMSTKIDQDRLLAA